MKIYTIWHDNHEQYEDHYTHIVEVHSNKDNANIRLVELNTKIKPLSKGEWLKSDLYEPNDAYATDDLYEYYIQDLEYQQQGSHYIKEFEVIDTLDIVNEQTVDEVAQQEYYDQLESDELDTIYNPED